MSIPGPQMMDQLQQTAQPQPQPQQPVAPQPPQEPTPEIPKKLEEFIAATNIAETLNEEDLAAYGKQVVNGYEIDLDSRSDWEDIIDKSMKLVTQTMETKSYPWAGAANVKYPLITTAALQFNARAYAAIVNGENTVTAKVTGPDPTGEKAAKAQRVSRHMNYQLFEEMEEWEEDTDRLTLVVSIVGCVFRKTYYSPEKRRNVSELVLPKHLVVNMNARSLETAPRVSHEFTRYPYEIQEMFASGVWMDPTLDGDESFAFEDEEKQTPETFIEQHCLLDLDDDDYPEPYIVTVHKSTGKVMRIVARYNAKRVDMKNGKVWRIRPRQYYTKYGFIPNPEGGFYDIGFGTLLLPLNASVNSTLNQLLDAGHLANTQSGFIGGNLRLKGGPLRLTPGAFKNVPMSGGNIRENFVQIQFPEPSMVLFQLLGFLVSAAQDISSVKDILTGESSSNETATTTLAKVEQGLKAFTTIYKRLYRSLRKEYKKLYELNAEFLDDTVYFQLNDDPEVVMKSDYAIGSLDLRPVADPAMSSDVQKLTKAQALMQFQGHPLLDDKKVMDRMLEALNIPDFKDLYKTEEQQQAAQAQQARQAELEERKIGIEEKKVQIDASRAIEEAELNDAQIKSTLAQALDRIASAEARDEGSQLAIYKAELDALGEAINGQDGVQGTQGGVSEVAPQSANGDGSQVSG